MFNPKVAGYLVYVRSVKFKAFFCEIHICYMSFQIFISCSKIQNNDELSNHTITNSINFDIEERTNYLLSKTILYG